MVGARNYQVRQNEIEFAVQRLSITAQTFADALEQKIQGTAQLQFGLARVRDLNVRDKAACSAFLAEVLDKQAQYTGILTIDPDGSLFCDSLRSGRTLDLRDRNYFKRALETTGSVVLEAAFGRLTQMSVLQIAFPVRDESQSLQFVLLASFNLSKFVNEQSANLLRGEEFLLVDVKGTVMASARRPDLLGTSIADSDLFRFATKNVGVTTELLGLEGVPQVWTVAQSTLVQQAGLYVLVGRSKAELAATANQRLAEDLGTLAVLTLILLGVVWLVVELGIRSPIERISQMAERLGAGDLNARVLAPYPSGELGSLMRVLNDSAASMQHQRSDIEELNQKLKELLAVTESHYTKARQFQDILHHAPLAVSVIGRNGRLRFVNSEYQRRLSRGPDRAAMTAGKLPDDFIDKTLHEIFSAEWAARITALNDEIFATKKVAQYELRSPESRTHLITKFPLIDGEGNVEAVGSISVDISDAKTARTINLRIFEKSLDLILITDSKGVLSRVSPSIIAILGYRPDEVEGQNAIQFIYPDDLEATRVEMQLARRGRTIRNFETRYIHKEGHAVRLNWTGMWVDEEQQHFFIGQDMTHRLRLEEELRQAQKMEALGQLTGGLAHDYNNLLTVILGNAELLMESLTDQPELLPLAKVTVDAAERSAVLTQRLLAFGRRQALNPRPTDINQLLNGMTDLIRVTVGETFQIDLALTDSPWTVKVDRVQLETAVLNLVVNARDAMGATGVLKIETTKESFDVDTIQESPEVRAGKFMTLAVIDNGSGMSPETVARVFEPFFTTKEVGKGTGLGLSMVYGFVKQSGGHISVNSESGLGTSVKLYFPAID